MEIKAYICPQCGASLDVNQSTTFTFCPHCGTRLHISYQGEQDPNLRQFVTAEGVPLATARIPAGFTAEASISRQWQSEVVPFMTYLIAKSPDGDISLASASREMFHDIKSTALKGMLSLVQNHIKSGYVPFIEPDAYIQRWAEQTTGTSLTPVAKAGLPSPLGSNPELARAQLQNEINLYNTFWGEAFSPVNELCNSVLYKFIGNVNGQRIVVLAGVDYQGAELSGGLPMGLGSMTAAFPGLKNILGGGEQKSSSGLRDAIGTAIHGDGNGIGKMTMGDWMRGGLVGKMMRDRKAAQQAVTQPQSTTHQQQNPQPRQTDGPIPFGHGAEYGKKVTMISYGSFRRYLCLCDESREQEATEYFLQFVASIQPDPTLAQQEQQQIQQKFAMVQQEASRNSAMAQQMQMQTRQMQMQTSQMIARNNQQVSAGIMDSWNKRQAAQGRMSASFSEAVRGVNTYYTPTGGTVEMNVSADHVYQNQYGDTIGVSGNAVDANVASKLNWTELEKK